MKTKNCSNCHRQGKALKSFCKVCKLTHKNHKRSWWIKKSEDKNYARIFGCMNSDFINGDDGDI